MKYRFDTSARRKIYNANRVACITPAPHPTRILAHHDIFYILSGGYTVEVCDQIIKAGKDDVLILPAGILHKGTENCLPNTQTIWLLMEKEENDACIDDTDNATDGEVLPISFSVNASASPSIRKLFEKILLAHINDDRIRSSAYSSLLLCELYDADRKKDSQLLLAEEIKKKIDLSSNLNISNAEIAESLNKSVKTVETVFKKHFGQTIHSYALKEKLKQAQMYLRNFPYMPMRDIAEALGFYDEYHFSRQFKKEFGISPREYKKVFFSVDRFNFSKNK